jgi:putative transposase
MTPSATPSGCIAAFLSAIGMWKTSCSFVGSSSRTKPSASGVGNSGSSMPIHCDAGVLTINKARHSLWRAVDQDGNVLDILGQRRRDKKAAKRFFRQRLKGRTYVPRVLILDTRTSYGAAKRKMLPGGEHCQHQYLNNRAEHSHQPTRQRERRRQGFKAPGPAQRFLAAYGAIAQHLRPHRPRWSAPPDRQERRKRGQGWDEITGTRMAA